MGVFFLVLYQKVYNKTHNYCALPKANTGIKTLPPPYIVYVINLSKLRYLYLLLSLIVLAYVVSVINICGRTLSI